MVLALVCVGLLLFFIHHISQAISVNHIVDRIAAETESMIDEIMPWPHRLNRHLKDAEPLRPNPSEVAVLSVDSGYIRFVDTRRLVALAKHYHVTIRVLRRVGHFVPAGIPLMMVSKGKRPPRRSCRAAYSVRLRLDQNVAAGRGVWRPANCRCCVKGDLARRQRPHHCDQLRRSVEPHSDPLRVPTATGGFALRSSGHHSRQYWMDPLLAPTGCGL